VSHPFRTTNAKFFAGLSDVERAFVHVDYDGVHDIGEEHKPLYEPKDPKTPFLDRVREKVPGLKPKVREEPAQEGLRVETTSDTSRD
jgi:hypothetical protein